MYEDTPASNMRKIISRRLTESKSTVPHFYTSIEIPLDNILSLLATRARDNKLAPEEFQGGTFTISNLGMFGISEFSAVINLPQGAILAVGGGERKIVPGRVNVETGEKEKPKIETTMTARLSADRRVVDEATAAVFMSALKEYMSQPKLMML